VRGAAARGKRPGAACLRARCGPWGLLVPNLLLPRAACIPLNPRNAKESARVVLGRHVSSRAERTPKRSRRAGLSVSVHVGPSGRLVQRGDGRKNRARRATPIRPSHVAGGTNFRWPKRHDHVGASGDFGFSVGPSTSTAAPSGGSGLLGYATLIHRAAG
jgi:hypothetical protein